MESMHTFIKNMDRGFHEQAQNWRDLESGKRVDTLRFFAHEANKAGIVPEPKELQDHTDYWMRYLRADPKNLNHWLKVKRFAADNWALERVMEEAGVVARGPEAPSVEIARKQFVTSTTQVIFPFFYDTNIQAGILAQPLLDRLVVETQMVTSGTADHAEMSEAAFERSTAEGGEGTVGRMVTIKARNRAITLRKFISNALASYEAMRRQRIDVFARGIQRVGEAFAILLTDYALDVLINGDGTTPSNAAGTTATGISGSPVYADVIALQLAFSQGYMPDMIVANGGATGSLSDLLNMVEFKDPQAGFTFQRTGAYPTPLGMDLVRWDLTGNIDATSWSATRILMLQTNLALMAYTEGGLMTESQRIIDDQWEKIVTSMWIGFGVWDSASRRVGTGW